MDPNAAATQPVQQANGQVPPPPSGGTPVSNPNYQASATTSATPSTPPPPPGGGTPVANPHYVAPTLSRTDDSIPAFLRDSMDVSKIKQTVKTTPPTGNKNRIDDPPKGVVAEETNPNNINVYLPGHYDSDARNHELVHAYQDTRSSDLPSPKYDYNPVSPTHDRYDYSGASTSSRMLPEKQQMQVKLQGLQKARNSGKTIADFNTEQQAEIVRDYKKQHDAFLNKVKTGKATKADLQKMSDLQNTYHPFIEQLAKMPGKSDKVSPGLNQGTRAFLNLLLGRNMPTIDTKPDAPGLPSFATAGMGEVVADPLMGGYSQPIHRKEKK